MPNAKIDGQLIKLINDTLVSGGLPREGLPDSKRYDLPDALPKLHDIHEVYSDYLSKAKEKDAKLGDEKCYKILTSCAAELTKTNLLAASVCYFLCHNFRGRRFYDDLDTVRSATTLRESGYLSECKSDSSAHEIHTEMLSNIPSGSYRANCLAMFELFQDAHQKHIAACVLKSWRNMGLLSTESKVDSDARLTLRETFEETGLELVQSLQKPDLELDDYLFNKLQPYRKSILNVIIKSYSERTDYYSIIEILKPENHNNVYTLLKTPTSQMGLKLSGNEETTSIRLLRVHALLISADFLESKEHQASFQTLRKDVVNYLLQYDTSGELTQKVLGNPKAKAILATPTNKLAFHFSFYKETGSIRKLNEKLELIRTQPSRDLRM